jgi:ESS family glutamate:Na+ symporter
MQQALITLALAIILVFMGNILGKVFPVLKRFSLPGAVLGGIIALLLGPQIAGVDENLKDIEVGAVYEQLADFPGIFINLVFACLMLGRRFDSPKEIWTRARPQVIMGHIYAWGQYVVGLVIVLLVLVPMFDISELAGAVIAIGFQGGHGTAAGLGENFSALGFEQGEAFAMAVATVGILSGVILGPILANILVKRYKLGGEEPVKENVQNKNNDADLPQVLKPNPLTGRLTVHLGLVCLVVVAGWSVLQAFNSLEYSIRGENAKQYITDFIPLFSVVLVIGMAVQAILQSLSWDRLFDRALFEKISSFALDMVIFAALATLSLEVISSNWQSLLILCAAGLGWNLLVFFSLGRYIYRKPWHAYGVGDLGGGTATTASGILLIKVVDPDNKTDAMDSYADKQPFYEPIMGGGLVTAFALPTVATLGAGVSLAITGTILTAWLVLAWWTWRE